MVSRSSRFVARYQVEVAVAVVDGCPTFARLVDSMFGGYGRRASA